MIRPRAVILACLGLCIAGGGCASGREKADQRRSLINSQASRDQFDRHVREFWSLGMTRDEVETAAMDARVEVRPTQDARALREIDPEYAGRPALVAQVGPPGIFIDVKYFKAHQQVGWLYFFFDENDRLGRVIYRLSNEQEARAGAPTRVILPEGVAP
jgi:hypothetical protein